MIHWSPPPLGFVKLNVVAAIAQNSSALAVVARNEQGAVLKAWSKFMPNRTPIAAEAKAILWALHLARGENWRMIIVESDAKICINSILDHIGCPQWAISSLVSDIWLLEKSFVSCLFFWVKRSGNAATHEAAKYTLQSFSSFSFYSDNLLASVTSVCLRCPGFVSFWLLMKYIEVYPKKKKIIEPCLVAFHIHRTIQGDVLQL